MSIIGNEVTKSDSAFIGNYFIQQKNLIQDPGLEFSSTRVDPRPRFFTDNNLNDEPLGFFENVNFRGAFEPNTDNWMKGWTITSLEWIQN